MAESYDYNALGVQRRASPTIRSQSPQIFGAVRQTLRRSRSPKLRSGSRPQLPISHPIPIERPELHERPKTSHDMRSTRSASPGPSGPPAHIRARSPPRRRQKPRLPAASREWTPEWQMLQSHRSPKLCAPPSPPESLHYDAMPEPLRPHRAIYHQPKPANASSPQIARMLTEIPSFAIRSPKLTWSDLSSTDSLMHSSRKNVTSLNDYLSLEQLEHLWQNQDYYKGPASIPMASKPSSPLWRINDDDPRSPIHPAFRDDPFSIQHVYTSPSIRI